MKKTTTSIQSTTKSTAPATAKSSTTKQKPIPKTIHPPVTPISVPMATPGGTTSPPTPTGTPSGALSTTSAVTGTTPTTTSSVPSNLSAPPDVTLPQIPVGFVAPSARAFFGYYATEAEVSAAPLALHDLGNFASYTAILGASAPSVSSVTGTLTMALDWRASRVAAEAWAAYATTQDYVAWKAALMVLDDLKPLFLLAVKKNADLATQYAGLVQLFDAGKLVAAEAAVTRKKNAKSKAAKAAQAATSATVTAGTAPATAAASGGTATAVPVAPKSTTVTTF